MCRRIGCDIPEWIDEGLVDVLIPAGGYAMDPSIDLASYLDLCRGTGIAVYPGLDNSLDVYKEGVHAGHEDYVGSEDRVTKDKIRVRAVASRYHRGGGDGVYIFNWHAGRDSRRDLLTQVGSRDTLRRRDKIYAATHRNLRNEGPWRGPLRNDRILGDAPVALKRTITGDGPTITLDVADDLTPRTSRSVWSWSSGTRKVDGYRRPDRPHLCAVPQRERKQIP